jgi:hypothetical protein
LSSRATSLPALILVDLQNEFVPGGASAVPDGARQLNGAGPFSDARPFPVVSIGLQKSDLSRLVASRLPRALLLAFSMFRITRALIAARFRLLVGRHFSRDRLRGRLGVTSYGRSSV